MKLERWGEARTWMVAPLAYQNGPLTPYSQATFELCNIVAAHVHYQYIFRIRSYIIEKPSLNHQIEMHKTGRLSPMGFWPSSIRITHHPYVQVSHKIQEKNVCSICNFKLYIWFNQNRLK